MSREIGISEHHHLFCFSLVIQQESLACIHGSQFPPICCRFRYSTCVQESSMLSSQSAFPNLCVGRGQTQNLSEILQAKLKRKKYEEIIYPNLFKPYILIKFVNLRKMSVLRKNGHQTSNKRIKNEQIIYKKSRMNFSIN